MGRENHFGRSGREHATGLGRAGLDHHRPALVVEAMQLLRIEDHVRRAIPQDRVRLPTVPEPQHDVQELAGPFIAVGVPEAHAQIVVPRLGVERGGDEVPAGPAATDEIE